MNPKFTFVDLFAGIGGFRLALEHFGGQCVGFSEIAQDAIHAYCDNFSEPINNNLGDIRKIVNLPKHDFMTAGVPCQSWSIAGKNLGFDDDRGQLWNDALYLLNKAQPKVFIFENVKGLSDPRNQDALYYIMTRIKEAGYHARKYVINAYDYGVPQTRVRIYIVGFKEEKFFRRFSLSKTCAGRVQLRDVLDEFPQVCRENGCLDFSKSLSCSKNGINDYFLFNDLRNGDTTLHSWDIQDTTERQKNICMLLLRNRRKKRYGALDGNPLSLMHFQDLDDTITEEELKELVDLEILKEVSYLYKIVNFDSNKGEDEDSPKTFLLSLAQNSCLNVDVVKNNREAKKRKLDVIALLHELEEEGCVQCIERRYDFKNSKISTGLNGINRIFLPSSKIYPTLVASDTNDFVTDISIESDDIEEFRKLFMDKVYFSGRYRKISQVEACRIQGFPDDFLLPDTRSRWMKLIGNSVAVPVVKMLVENVVDTGVFENDIIFVPVKSNKICSSFKSEGTYEQSLFV